MTWTEWAEQGCTIEEEAQALLDAGIDPDPAKWKKGDLLKAHDVLTKVNLEKRKRNNP